MSKQRSFAHVLSAPRKALIELMFEKHEYSEEDIKDFFELEAADRRFADEKKRIREARARRKEPPPLEPRQLELCTD